MTRLLNVLLFLHLLQQTVYEGFANWFLHLVADF